MLARIFRGISSVPWTKAWDADIVGGGTRSWAGHRVTVDTAQQLLAVYGCVQFVASHVSTMPLDTYRRRPDGAPLALGNPAWLETPHGADRSTMLGQLLWSYLLDGNAFAVVVRDGLGRVVELVPVHPSDIDIAYDAAGVIVAQIKGRRFTGELLHIPNLVPPGQVRGISPIEAARQSVGVGLAATEFGARFFSNGSTLSGVISFPGQAPGKEDLKALRESWQRTYGGTERSHLPGVLFGGATWTPISISPEQAQFLETRRYTAAEIAGQLFGLPPTVLGIPVEAASTITYSNVSSQWDDVMRRIQPTIVKFERHLSALLPRPQYVRFNADAYLRPDLAARTQIHATWVSSGLGTVNERRAIEDLAPVDGGDVLYRPAGLDAVSAEDDGAGRARSLAEIVQKLYLGVGVMLTADEARAIANEAGASLPGTYAPQGG